jgi:DNA-binding PadR family transcriptional regulator
MSIRQGLLALLSVEPKHGYQLKSELESATGGLWPINVGQVYTTLDRLVRDGFVDFTTTADDQKQYLLTDDGVAELGRWWQLVPGEEPPPRDELMVKVLLAIATAPATALDVITAQRTAVIELLQRRRRLQQRAAGHTTSIAQRLAEDALIVRAEADLRWLDLCESRLVASRTATPAPRRPAPEKARAPKGTKR